MRRSKKILFGVIAVILLIGINAVISYYRMTNFLESSPTLTELTEAEQETVREWISEHFGAFESCDVLSVQYLSTLWGADVEVVINAANFVAFSKYNTPGMATINRGQGDERIIFSEHAGEPFHELVKDYYYRTHFHIFRF